MRWVPPRLLAACMALLMASAHADKLTIDRIFAAPDLAGTSLRSVRISPDGRLVTYLRGSAADKDRLDLWAYDIAHREHRLLVEAARLAPDSHALSAEEVARRERQRTSALSGIVEYEFSADSHRLLIPLAGELYLYDLQASGAKAVRHLGGSGATDARFSPRDHFVSFIRQQNLFVIDLASGTERAVTRDGAGVISYGTAEFVAQEEMGRTTGYWWSPDERRIAYTRVDESPVHEVQRFEIYADSTRVINQRYPATGTANALVELLISSVTRDADTPGTITVSTPTRVDLGSNPDVYLARVNWFPDSLAVAVQRESRDQKTLTLLRADALTGESRELLCEHSSTWIDLTDNFTFLPHARQFIWTSSRSGFQHLYLYDESGNLVRPLTQGEWQVTGDGDNLGLRGVDEKHGLVYFTANAQTPIERHLYSVSLTDASAPMRKITDASGWHAVSMSADAHFFLDTFSTPDSPPSVTLRAVDGTEMASLAPNRITPDHPYAPFMSEHLPTEFGTLAAADGQTMYYQMLRPRNLVPGRRYPAIVDVYGGPGSQRVRKAWGGSTRTNEGYFRQFLAQNGYVVFTLDNRGSGFRGVRFETALYRHLGSVEVQDQLAGVAYLKSLPFVDPARIGVFGWSYGGFMALMCMMQAPDSFAAAVAGAPVTDWSLYDTHYTERYLGTPQTDPGAYAKSGVLPYVANIKGPLLVMHGLADDNVLFTNSTVLFSRLQQLRKPFDVMTYPGGKHGLLRHADMGPHGYLTVKGFFDRTIGDGASAVSH